MSEVRLRVRTVSEIVDAAFALYRRDSGQYILIMAVASLPQVLIRLFLQGNPQSFGFTSVIFSLIGGLVSILTLTVASAAIMKFGSEVYLDERADLSEAVRAVIPKLGAILWAGFLMSILLFIGFLVFFLGEFYVIARFFAVTPAIVLEDAAVGEAFSRSSVLSDGRKRHILNTLLLVYIIYFLLAAAVGAFTLVTKSVVLGIIVSTGFSIIAYPILGLTALVLYYDCRIRGEGFDIERMSASLDRPGAAPGAAGAATF
jgi:hypothetical protein